MTSNKKSRITSYNKWGYIFLIPFMVVFVVFQLIPLVTTIYNSFFENYMSGLKQVGPNFIGLKNYVQLLTQGDQRFFKTVIYLPNLIMASAFSMLFFTLFANTGPVNSILVNIGIFKEPYQFMSHAGTVRGLVAMMNCLMWFGNTTILLMAGMMGISDSLYEAAEVDGATPTQIFFRITLPLLKPIFIYVVVTSLIGGLQMFDVPQILTNGTGDPMRTSMTLIMYLNKHLYSKNYGLAGALSVLLLILTGILSLIVFRTTAKDELK